MLKISIITVTYNSAKTLQETINSVAMQDYPNIEYIVVDGNSKDRTLEIIKENQDVIHKWISESDRGLYHAMNKGIEMATGDVIGIINSDDFYHRKNSVTRIIAALEKQGVQCAFADIIYVDPENINKTIRYYSSAHFKPWKLRFGFMPAHPTFFTYKKNFEKLGAYKEGYKIGADFELLLRFLFKHRLSYTYVPIDLLKMRTGGISNRSWKSTIRINVENLRAFKENGLYTNYLFLTSRYFIKAFHFVPALNNRRVKKRENA